jgi:uncharacterized protein (DUF305 family)
MVEHHAQAIQMANFTIGREGIDPRIVELAEEIRVSQTEEIATLADLLEGWGETPPETGFGPGDAHTHENDMDPGEHGDMPGMMSGEEMERLAAAPDSDFARMWLEMMVEHHRGAVTMVDTVQDDGKHERLRDLADEIETVQRTEVKDMQRWLDGT